MRVHLCSTLAFSFLLTLVSSAAPNVQELNRALIAAAKGGDVSAVARLLGEGANPNAVGISDSPKWTAFQEAVRNNHLEVVKTLLDHGADLRPNGYSVLELALDKSHETVARFLLTRGLSVNDRDSKGETSLSRHFDYSPLNLEEIEFLLYLGADPNLPNNHGKTALMNAAETFVLTQKNDRDGPALARAIALLLKHGADVKARDEQGATPLYYAASEGSMIAITALIAAGADVNAQTNEGDSALLVTLRRNDRDGRIEYLIAHDADVKARDNQDHTALMFAIRSGYRKQAELCLKRGVDPNARTKSGTSAAHFAGQFSSRETWPRPGASADLRGRRDAVEMLRLLAAYRADLAVEDLEGDTAAHAAARSGYVESLRFLAEQGGDLNKPNRKGETPLFLSVPSGLDGFAKAKVLLAKGAEINGPGPGGRTPLMLATDLMIRGQIMQILQQKADANLIDAHGETALILGAASWGDRFVEPTHYVAIIRALAKATASVDQRDRRGMTPLIWAAISNVPETVLALLEKGADVNGRGADGRTPLMWAASANARRTMATLIGRGADREAKDNEGKSALDWARVLDETIMSLPLGEAKPE